MNVKSTQGGWAIATVVLGIVLAIGVNHRAVSAQQGAEPLMEDVF